MYGKCVIPLLDLRNLKKTKQKTFKIFFINVQKDCLRNVKIAIRKFIRYFIFLTDEIYE